jgi:hypothetical protein
LGRNPVRDHADDIQQIRALADAIAPADLGRAFTASLTSRRLPYRSALGSSAVARVLPDHALVAREGAYATICQTCGWSQMPSPAEDVPTEHLAREREKYGGVRHTDPQYILFDLTSFRELETLEPTAADWRCLDLILWTPRLLDSGAKPADYERALKGVFPSNKNERTVLIQILSYAGVLEPADHPTFFDEYVPPHHRALPPYRFADWGYPAIWWRAQDGIREDAVGFWFPEVSERRAV